MIEKIVNLERHIKNAIVIFFDILISVLSTWLAFCLRLEVIFIPKEKAPSDQETFTSDDSVLLNKDNQDIYATVNLLSNVENISVSYSILNNDLVVQDKVKTKEEELSLIFGQYVFDISSEGYNNLIFNLDLNEKRIYDIEVNLIESNNLNSDMQMISAGFLSSDETGAIIKEFMIGNTFMN